MTAKLENRWKLDGTLNVSLVGRWQTGHKTPSGMDAHILLNTSDTKRIQFDSRRLDGWDSSLVVFLSAVVERCTSLNVDVDLDGLPSGARRLLSLSHAVPRQVASDVMHDRISILAHLGELGLTAAQTVKNTLDFTGELALSVQYA
jgi:ABC-type transporter Mla MlaB component